MRFLTAIAVALSLVVLPLAACGKDSGSGGSAESASLAPASSIVYVEANIADGGDVDELLAKFPGGGDAGAKIQDAIEKSLREDDAPISYEQDVKPWLGDQIAFFVNGRIDASGDVQDAAALIQTTDEDASLKAIDKAAEGKAKDASYKDHDYKALSGDGGEPGAAGVIDGWLVVGTVSGFKGAVDASEGDGLGGSDKFEQAMKNASDDRLGLLYVDGKAFYDIARTQDGGEALESFKEAFEQPYVMTLDATSDAVELAATIDASGFDGAVPFLSEGTDLVADVPAGSWFAMGQPKLGETVDKFIEIGAEAAGGRAQLERQLGMATGMSIEELTGWMGDFAVYVKGTSIADLSGAVIVQSTDEAQSKKVLAKAAQLAQASGAQVGKLKVEGDGFTLSQPGLPQPIHVFQRDGKVVIAYGDEAASEALGGSDTLGDSSEYKSATEGLGDDYAVSTWLAIAPIVQLLEGTPAASASEWTQVKSYLEPLGALVSGAKADGDEVSSVMRITVP